MEKLLLRPAQDYRRADAQGAHKKYEQLKDAVLEMIAGEIARLDNEQ